MRTSTSLMSSATAVAALLMLNCHPDFEPPSGYRKEPAPVKGRVLTDYHKDA
ncbi:hypothetical protein ABZY81_03175 [Streptomyces sp. NPDC006514]|uniref:hypothetical protein n=1 Tax=Streptomyces sp. NPDC006514 TaxID=3154308 RepID=UPI0033AF107A